jgi:5'(3')-deoxyribonucleotidase
MSVENKIIGVDLDGVCADFYGRMREIAAEWFERPLTSLPMKVTYGLPEWGITSPNQYVSLHRFAVLQKNLFESLEMMPGARKYLRKLSDEKAHIRIVTHRLFIYYFHRNAVVQTIDWLDRHGIPYKSICFLKEKEHVNADVYIEDNPENVENLRDSGLHAICFANSTNTKIKRPRAKTWEEVYKMIHEHLD